MLYQGALRFLRQAQDDMRRQDYVHKRQSIDRAAAIVHYLQVTLDSEKGGEISCELNRIYTYMKVRIFDGSAKLDCKPIDEVIRLLETLLSGWEQLAIRNERPAVSQEAARQPVSGERFEIQA